MFPWRCGRGRLPGISQTSVIFIRQDSNQPLKNKHFPPLLEGNISYNFPVSPLGKSYMVLSGGKIFGKVPYPLLKLHEGNATYFYDQYAFSCMNYYEFASDLWASFIWEHHFKGFFLGKIPLETGKL
mgnify:CR=1 FL=1